MRTSVIDFFGSCSESLIQTILGPVFPLRVMKNTNLTAYKVKRGNLERNLAFRRRLLATQQDCAGGPEQCWCRSCAYANSKPTNIAEFAVVSKEHSGINGRVVLN